MQAPSGSSRAAHRRRARANNQPPLIVAHRGASGYRPEHTLEAYQLAIDLGADYIEPDLVITADGVLVARHEAELSTTTDVADRPEFAGRRRTTLLDGREVSGWFVEDFTAAEVATLRARERLIDIRQQSSMYDDLFGVPTFGDIAALAKRESRRLGRSIGVYPELKHPTYFAEYGLRHDDALLAAVAEAGLDASEVWIQCFEPSTLHRLAARTTLPLVQLVNAAGQPFDWEKQEHGRTFTDMLTPAGLQELASYASAVGAHKSLVIPRHADGRLAGPSDLVDGAHEAGMEVHAWTFRNENAFLPADHRRGQQAALYGDALGEYAAFFAAGVDAVFTDHPDTARAATERVTVPT